jgi:hypothetical protein
MSHTMVRCSGVLLALLTLVWASVAWDQTMPAGVPVETVDAVRQTVIPLICASETDRGRGLDPKKIVGSGFWLNRLGQFLTAAHVVNTWRPATPTGAPCVPAVYFPVDGWTPEADTKLRGARFTLTDCQLDRDLDVAACRTLQNPFHEVLIRRPIAPARLERSVARYDDGTAVAFTGFPLNSVRPITSKGFLASYRARERMLLVDKTAWPGASGSPVYVGSGAVIGVLIRRGHGDSEGLAYARAIEPIREFLLRRQIPFEDAD